MCMSVLRGLIIHHVLIIEIYGTSCSMRKAAKVIVGGNVPIWCYHSCIHSK